MNERKHELQFKPELRQYLLPTLVYYLKLLELPNLELETYIRQELETNPLIEETAQESDDESERIDDENDSDESSAKDDDALSIVELFSESKSVDFEIPEDYFDPIDNAPAQGERLYDILMKQARNTFREEEMEIAELIISNIEDDGYLAASPQNLCGNEYELPLVEHIIKLIQCFDPVGCAWRTIEEPLLIQLKHKGYHEDSVEYKMVRDHFKNLKASNPKEILKQLDIDEKRFLQAKEVIMQLDPKPGWRYSGTPSRYVNPDFIITWKDNKLCAGMCDDSAPRIRIRRHYLEVMKHRAGVPKEELDFIRQRIQSAQNLIMAIEQRRKTLAKIIEGILEYQNEFFEKGDRFLKPMTMTEFAHQLGVNPSTISRALANKYLESPRGIHKLKYFFTAAVGHIDKRVIYNKIKDIVDNEDKTAPLSDTQIAKKLSRDGIIISRRTVSKYRDTLSIPAHQFRRA